jgi:predicted nucleic-acid-binding Zn-ribbon protein
MASLLPCPACGAYEFYQSRPRNLIEKFRKKYLFQNAYRCHKCGLRTWLRMPINLPSIRLRHITILTIILLLSFLISHMVISAGF